MTVYTIVKFLHVVGAIGYFVAVGTTLVGLAALQRARRVEQVLAFAELVRRLTPLFNLSILLLLLAGLYMTATVWGFETGWIDVALVSLVILVPIAAVIVQSHLRVIAQLANAEADGPLSAELLARTHDPTLLTTPRTVTALLVGIVFLMTNKPALPMALLVMASALVLGMVWGMLAARMSRAGGHGVRAPAAAGASELRE
ncbi:MAG TPA: DUF2269 family protein [Ktedonobacterales bacterium]|jgi:uncharacterized membrane protein|nr:DUF2269 family protein [Ktedonobacterales bacterium]